MRTLRIDLVKCNGGRTCQHECETVCATKVFKLKDAEHAALHIRLLPDGQAQTMLCDQCGDCVEVCPTQALARNRLGIVLLQKKLCTSCYMCIGFCDKNIFERSPDLLEPIKCTACSVCVKACPNGALEIADVPLVERTAAGKGSR